MASRKNKASLYAVIVAPVVVVIVAALALSGAAVMENLRFINAYSQIFSLVGTVRTIAAGQKGFAQNAGEDVWADLDRVESPISSESHANPWGGDVHMVTVANAAMRIESDLPVRDCRRLALYFLGHSPVELGLLGIQAQSSNNGNWGEIYPGPSGVKTDTLPEIACGSGTNARLALIFRIR